MFSLAALKTKLDTATTQEDVLQAFLDARTYGYGDAVFVTLAGDGINYPANHVMFETVRAGATLNGRLACMFTVIGTIDGVEHTYLGFNPYGGNATDMTNTMARQFGGKAAGQIIAEALGYEDYVIMEKCPTSTLYDTSVVIGAPGRTITSIDVWFASFIADGFPSTHWVNKNMQKAANTYAYQAPIVGWDSGSENHLCVDFTVRSADDQNIVDLMGVIQKAAIAELSDNVDAIDDVADDLAAETLRATTAEQAIVAAFEDTCAFGPTFKQAAAAVINMRDATGYIPRP